MRGGWYGLGWLGCWEFPFLIGENINRNGLCEHGGCLPLLIVAAVVTALFIGLEFTTGATLPVPGLPEEPPGSTMMILSAIPWILAGGFLGPWAAAGVGILSGLVRGAWDTHSLFTILDLGLMSVLFAVFARQKYRTPLYRSLRQPLIGALALIPIHTILFVLSALFTASTSATMTERLDYALSNAGVITLAFGVEVLVAGLVAQVLVVAFPAQWSGLGMLQPSPAEKSIETRFVSGTGMIISILLITLLAGDWFVAGRAARNLLGERLQSVAQVGAQSIPFFLETGQSLASQIASDPQLTQLPDSDLPGLLADQIQSVPYFNQLILFDMTTNSVVANYPFDSISQLTPQEETGILLTSQGVPNQMYAIPPVETNGAARLSFLAVVPNAQRVLISRTDLQSNPYMRSLINNLNSLQDVNGVGLLVDDQNNILYHPQAIADYDLV